MDISVKTEAAEEFRIGSQSKRTLPRKHKYRKSDNIFGLVTTLIPLVAFLFFSGSVLVIGFISQFTTMEYYDVSSMQWNNFETLLYPLYLFVGRGVAHVDAHVRLRKRHYQFGADGNLR